MILVELIQQIAKNQLDTEKPMQLAFGSVVSASGQPLRIRLSDKMILEEGMLVRTSRQPYEYGTRLILLRDHGGRRWYVMEVPGHNDLAGRDAENQHSVGSVTGLETALSALSDRCTALEGRATALEGRATALEGRATTLESDVADLKSRVTALEEWRQSFTPVNSNNE